MKCPKCEAAFVAPSMRAFTSSVPFGNMKWNCIAFCCPTCETIFSAQIDPIAIKTDTITELKRALGRP